MTNNIALAYSCVIENAIGSKNSDVLTGNSSGNRMEGGDGRDRSTAGRATTLVGNANADSLTGGLGNDSFFFAAAGTHCTAMDAIGDLEASDRIEFGMSGMALYAGAYGYAGSVNGTTAAIQNNKGRDQPGGPSATARTVTSTSRGAGGGSTFDGTLIALSAQDYFPALAQLVGVSANASLPARAWRRGDKPSPRQHPGRPRRPGHGQLPMENGRRQHRRRNRPALS
jgi:serralysin